MATPFSTISSASLARSISIYSPTFGNLFDENFENGRGGDGGEYPLGVSNLENRVAETIFLNHFSATQPNFFPPPTPHRRPFFVFLIIFVYLIIIIALNYLIFSFL